MKKPAWLLATALIVAMSFTACGPKNTDTVSKDDNTPVVSESTEKSSDKITSEDKTSDKNVDKQDSEKTESTESTDVSKKDDTTKSESVSDKKSDKKSDNKSNSNSTSNKKKTGNAKKNTDSKKNTNSGSTKKPETKTKVHTHEYNHVVTKEPTCVDAGVKTYTCKTCGNTYTENVKAKNHSYDNGVVTTQVAVHLVDSDNYTYNLHNQCLTHNHKSDTHHILHQYLLHNEDMISYHYHTYLSPLSYSNSILTLSIASATRGRRRSPVG